MLLDIRQCGTVITKREKTNNVRPEISQFTAGSFQVAVQEVIICVEKMEVGKKDEGSWRRKVYRDRALDIYRGSPRSPYLSLN